MHNEDLLDDLEAQIYTVDDKHDPRMAERAMAAWIRGLDDERQSTLRVAIRSWLRERHHPWHFRVALELAVSLGWGDVVDATVRMADAERLAHTEDEDDESFAAWLIYAIERLPTPEGRAMLSGLADRIPVARSSAARSITVRAFIARCRLEGGGVSCLRSARAWLRRWRDDELRRRWSPLIDRRMREFQAPS